MTFTYTDPIVILSIAFVSGYVLGRVDRRKEDVTVTIQPAPGTEMVEVKANRQGRRDNETPTAMVSGLETEE